MRLTRRQYWLVDGRVRPNIVVLRPYSPSFVLVQTFDRTTPPVTAVWLPSLLALLTFEYSSGSPDFSSVPLRLLTWNPGQHDERVLQVRRPLFHHTEHQSPRVDCLGNL